MSKLALILMATSAGLGLLSLHLVREMRAGQATITDLQAQLESLKQQAAASSALSAAPSLPALPATATLPPEAADGNNTSASLAAAPKVAVNSVVTKTADPTLLTIPSREERLRMFREGRERQRMLMQDPDYRDAMRVQNRRNFAHSYPAVAQELGLDSQQTDQFFDLLSEQQLHANEVMQPMWDTEGKDPTTLAEDQRRMQQQSAELQRRNEAEMAAQFGQEKLQAWKDYQSTLGVRHQVEQMRTTLASQGVALSEDMNKSMIKALAEANKLTADELSAARARGAASSGVIAFSGFGPSMLASSSSDSIERQMEMTRQSQQRTLDAISPYLTSEQRQVIQQEQEAQLKLQQAHLRLMRAQQRNSDSNAVISSSPGVTLLTDPSQ